MKHVKTLMALLVGTSLLLPGTAALALDSDIPAGENTPAINQNVEQARKWAEVQGVVKNVADDGSQITIISTDEQKTELVLNVSAETVFINNKTAEQSDIKQIKAGDTIYAYHSLMMTRSIPAQTPAIAIVTNLEKDATPAHLLEAKAVEAQKDGSVKITNVDNLAVVTILPDKPLTKISGEKAAVSDIKQGDRIFAWYDSMTLSLPGYATSNQTVIIGPAEAAEAKTKAADVNYTVTINGQAFDMDGLQAVVRNGEVMVPLRPVAEQLGFKLKWDDNNMAATIDDGNVKTTVTVGSNSYYKASSQAVGLTAPVQYKNAPMMIDNRTYIPVELFNLLYSNDSAVTISGSTVAITK